MLARTDRLYAVWDGKPARGYGGTADVVAEAEKRGIPVTVIWPSLSAAVRLRRSTLWCLAGMVAVFAVWSLFGFSYPSAPGRSH
jgi:hypothetical protein